MDAYKIVYEYLNSYRKKEISADQFRSQYFELYGKTQKRICECNTMLEFMDDKIDEPAYNKKFDECGTLSDKPVQPIWAYIGIGVGSLVLIGLLILIFKPKSKK